MLRCLRRTVSRVSRAAFFIVHKKYDVSGVVVIVSDPVAPIVDSLQKVRAALDLIATTDARCYRIVKKYVRHVIVWPGDYTAYDRWGGIHFAREYLEDANTPLVAAGLVHEATHLRIARSGIPYDPELRARIEALCVREQAAFLRRVADPRGEAWAIEAEEHLSRPWWIE